MRSSYSLSERNTPREYRPKSTFESIPQTDEEEIRNFDKETEELYYQLLEKQRQELSVYNRNYILDNTEVIDQANDILQVQDLDERKSIESEITQVEHQYHSKVNRINKRHSKEQAEFWKERNKGKTTLLRMSESSQQQSNILRPRSIVSSRISTPRGSAHPRKTQYYNDENDTVTFDSPVVRERRVMIDFEEKTPRRRNKSKIERKDHPKEISGFFLPTCRSMSRANKLGNFKRSKKRTNFEDNYF